MNLSKYVAALVAATAVFALAACGGGGGGGGLSNDSQPISAEAERLVAEYRSALGGIPLNLSANQIHSTLESRQAVADRLLATDTIGLSLSGPFREATTCSGNACIAFGERIAVSDIDFDADYYSLMIRNGVSVAAAS